MNNSTTVDTTHLNLAIDTKRHKSVESETQFGFLLNTVNLNKTSERLYSNMVQRQA